MNFLLKNEYRCFSCGKLLFQGILFSGRAEMKCLRCGRLVLFGGVSAFDGRNRYMLLTDLQGKILGSSDSVRNIIDFSSTELIGQNIGEIIAHEPEKNTDKIIALRSEEKKYLRFDTWHKDKSGSIIPVSVRYNFLKNKKGNDLILRTVDRIVPAGKHLAKQGVFSKKNQGDFVIEVDESGIVLYGNNNGRDMFGFAPEDVIGKSVEEFQPSEDIERRRNNYKVLVAERASYRIPDNRIFGKDGNIIEYETYCSPTFSSAGDFVGYNMTSWLKK